MNRPPRERARHLDPGAGRHGKGLPPSLRGHGKDVRSPAPIDVGAEDESSIR